MGEAIRSQGFDLFKGGVETPSEGEEALVVPGAGAGGEGLKGAISSMGEG